MIDDRIEQGRIIPVVALQNAQDAVPLCKALKAGGLEVAEITFRTAAAAEALRIVRERFPEFALGAGTVTTQAELQAACDAGAQFAVAPGFNPRIVRRAQELGLPFFPGIATPSEVEAALEAGCQTLKVFPAGTLGGPKHIKALSGPYAHRGVRFIPTGGVNAENVADYLALPTVLAVGGTWLAPRDLIAAGDWDRIRANVAEGLAAVGS
jgi:2-dehydro-3-deoxyphosphogluconate aldolase/(4S)-4-hydroxy-2-oxoglutarate aldolase